MQPKHSERLPATPSKQKMRLRLSSRRRLQVVTLALIVGGALLLGVVVYDFARSLGQGPFVEAVLELLSGLLLVFIFTELITTWEPPSSGVARLLLCQAAAGAAVCRRCSASLSCW
jgi:zinc transporter ZupT